MESVPSRSLPVWDALDARFDFTERELPREEGAHQVEKALPKGVRQNGVPRGRA